MEPSEACDGSPLGHALLLVQPRSQKGLQGSGGPNLLPSDAPSSERLVELPGRARNMSENACYRGFGAPLWWSGGLVSASLQGLSFPRRPPSLTPGNLLVLGIYRGPGPRGQNHPMVLLLPPSSVYLLNNKGVSPRPLLTRVLGHEVSRRRTQIVAAPGPVKLA